MTPSGIPVPDVVDPAGWGAAFEVGASAFKLHKSGLRAVLRRLPELVVAADLFGGYGVVGQEPAAGTLVPYGTVVYLDVRGDTWVDGSITFPEEEEALLARVVEVPTLTGLDINRALALRHAYRLPTRVEPCDGPVEGVVVHRQEPLPGTEVVAGDALVVLHLTPR